MHLMVLFIKNLVWKPHNKMVGLRENINISSMLVGLYCTNPNYLLLFGLMLFIMLFSSSIESLHLYCKINLPISCFIINYLTSLCLKFLVAYVMLPLYILTEPNYNQELESLFSWDTRQVIRVLLFMICILEKYLSLDMLLSMRTIFLTIIHLPQLLMTGSISLISLLHLLLTFLLPSLLLLMT
jgi:hypothetical protein